jgi:hypothetical protein
MELFVVQPLAGGLPVRAEFHAVTGIQQKSLNRVPYVLIVFRDENMYVHDDSSYHAYLKIA